MPDQELLHLRMHTPDAKRRTDSVVVGISAAAMLCFGSILTVAKHPVPGVDTQDNNHNLHAVSEEISMKEMTKEQAKCELERLVHHCAMHCDFQSASLLSNVLASEQPKVELIDAAVRNMRSTEAREAFIRLAAVLEQHPGLGQQVVPSLHRYFAKLPLTSPAQLIRPFVNQQAWCCDPHSVELVTSKFLTQQALRRERRNQKIVFSKE